MSDFNYPVVRENQALNLDFLRNVTRVVNNIMRGKTNNKSTVTLNASSTSTVVTDVNVGGDSIIVFMPTTANAALEFTNGGMYVSSTGDQTFTITHVNNAQVDRTFDYVVIG